MSSTLALSAPPSSPYLLILGFGFVGKELTIISSTNIDRKPWKQVLVLIRNPAHINEVKKSGGIPVVTDLEDPSSNALWRTFIKHASYIVGTSLHPSFFHGG